MIAFFLTDFEDFTQVGQRRAVIISRTEAVQFLQLCMSLEGFCPVAHKSGC